MTTNWICAHAISAIIFGDQVVESGSEELQLASPDVLDNATSNFKLGGRMRMLSKLKVSVVAVDRAVQLRQLGEPVANCRSTQGSPAKPFAGL